MFLLLLSKSPKKTFLSRFFDKYRGGSRTAATSKVEPFVIIVNGWNPLTITTKQFILDVAAVLDLLLKYEQISGFQKSLKKSFISFYAVFFILIKGCVPKNNLPILQLKVSVRCFVINWKKDSKNLAESWESV